MAEKIGIRELRNQASSILRHVREEAAEYVITHHGQPVAILHPISAEDSENLRRQESLKVWRNLLETGALLAGSGVGGKSALETLSEMRDEENVTSQYLGHYAA